MRVYYAVIVAALAVVVAGAFVREPECPTSRAARIPHPTDCTLYYICQDGKGMLHTCPDGLHFNNAIKQCDWPPAGCIPGSRPQTQPNVLDTEDNNLTRSSNCIGKCPIPNPKDKTILLRYRGDCTKFCSCSNGTPIVMNCPADLYFDVRNDICNWSWLVDCPWHKVKDTA